MFVRRRGACAEVHIAFVCLLAVWRFARCFVRCSLRDTACPRTAASRTKILRVYGFDSVRTLSSRGEIPRPKGSSPGNVAQGILA